MADSTPTGPHHQTPTSPKEKKRTRVQLSCTACRSRKLKCCRTYPCTNCKKRGEAASCTFVGRSPRGRAQHGRTSPAHIQDRLQHLENLILSFTQKKGPGQNQSLDTPELENTPPDDLQASSVQTILDTPPTSGTESEVKDHHLDTAGKLVVKDMSYFDGAHWRAILEEINEVKEYFQSDEERSEEESVEDQPLESSSPILLLGLNKPASKEELLADIPPRPVADRLVSQIVHARKPYMVILHIPTFLKEYNKFWLNPQEVSLPWLSLLYALLTLSVLVQRGKEEPPRGSLEDLDKFPKRTVQCLTQSNYTLPGKYKVEALFLYAMGEFEKSHDAQVSVSFLLGITIRLAMRMGYHRDSSQFPNISALDGEMRRRVWAVVSQLDVLVSFQVGIPKTIQAWQYDVELPSNLFDEDFDEDTEHLPPSRPETERTRMSYTRVKSKIMSVFGRIADIAYSREPVTYEQALELDRLLEEEHDRIPPILRIRPMAQSIVDFPDLILERYTLEILYQKSRCVLHRRYLANVHSNIRYAYSRWVCMNASKEILKQQASVFHESQPGGLLYRDRQFPSSIQISDYLLAAMIICLELSSDHPTEVQSKSSNDVSVVINGREDLLATLETSHKIFGEIRRWSADSQKAYAALSIMLRRVKRGAQNIQRSENLGNGLSDQAHDTSIAGPPPYGSWQNPENNPVYSFDTTTTLAQAQMNTIEPPFGSLDVIEEMLDAPTSLDWNIWDQQIQAFGNTNMNNLWFPETMPSG